MNSFGKILAGAAVVFVVGGGVGAAVAHDVEVAHSTTQAHTNVGAVPTRDQQPIMTMLSDPQAATLHIKPTSAALVDSVTQGDDTIDIVRVEATDDQGAMTFYFVVENGKVSGATYAQNGSGN